MEGRLLGVGRLANLAFNSLNSVSLPGHILGLEKKRRGRAASLKSTAGGRVTGFRGMLRFCSRHKPVFKDLPPVQASERNSVKLHQFEQKRKSFPIFPTR